MIRIKPSPTADTRSSDFQTVTKEQLLEASRQHIADVGAGLAFLSAYLTKAASVHDYDKLTDADWFHEDFVTGFKQTGWWDNHRKIHRHHLNQPDGIPEDANLLDVLESLVDGAMAGMARKGEAYRPEIDPDVLMKAYQNTFDLIISQIVVAPPFKPKTATCLGLGCGAFRADELTTQFCPTCGGSLHYD